MIRLVNKPNTNAATSPYPYGSLRDNPGDNTGTPVNKLVVEDSHQFFEKMFVQSGLTANGLPDNEANGWQLFEAFLASVGTNIIPTYAGDWGTTLDLLKVRKVPGRMVQIAGRVGSAAGADLPATETVMFTLPAGYRPAGTKDKQLFCAVNNTFYRVRIETTGEVKLISTGSATPSYNLRLDFTFALD